MSLDAIRQRLNAATPGPWFSVVNDLIGGRAVTAVDKPMHAIDHRRGDRVVADMLNTDADAEFIAHAREDVEHLLAIAEAVRAYLEAIVRDEGNHVELARAALAALTTDDEDPS